MKINPLMPQSAIDFYKIKNGRQAAKSTAVTLYDKVDLSESGMSFASVIGAIKESMGAQPADQAERINRIIEQIKNGTYNVPASEVADKILGD